MNVVGARPQFIKAGPVSHALLEAEAKEVLVHTGQHYDDLMSDLIMRDVGLREPDINLEVGSGSHGVQTARMLERLEGVIVEIAPDAVLTYGDTNSTVAAALAATKLGVPTGHVEAGLRSFNRAMPEELNRVATDHLSDLLFAPTQTALDRLATEGLADRSLLTGDVMVDALTTVDLEQVPVPPWAEGTFVIATLHRPSNTDNPERLGAILKAFGTLPHTVHLLAHPRLRDRLNRFTIGSMPASVMIHDPLPYSAMLGSLVRSSGLLTDSGGLQKEAFLLRVPCSTIRAETEWPETLMGGWNVLVGERLDDLAEIITRTPDPLEASPFGHGSAATHIVEKLLDHLS